MFVPVPAAEEQAPESAPPADLATLPPLAPPEEPVEWPALHRLAWLCPYLARGNVVVCGLVAVISACVMIFTHAPETTRSALVYSLLFSAAAVLGYLFLLALGEAIRLAIAVERNTRPADGDAPPDDLPADAPAAELHVRHAAGRSRLDR